MERREADASVVQLDLCELGSELADVVTNAHRGARHFGDRSSCRGQHETTTVVTISDPRERLLDALGVLQTLDLLELLQGVLHLEGLTVQVAANVRRALVERRTASASASRTGSKKPAPLVSGRPRKSTAARGRIPHDAIADNMTVAAPKDGE